MQDSSLVFGKPLQSKLFLLEEGFINLNHGSFGATPRIIVQKQNQIMLEAEQHPDRWFRSRYFDHINVARERVAELINANDVNDVILLENASSAINGILRSIPLKRGDKVLRLSTAYGMCIEVLNWLQSTIGIEQVVVTVEFPYEDPTKLLAAVEAAFQQHGSIKLALFSHISSMPTLVEPVTELSGLAKQHGCIALIDGAHAPGVLHIDVEKIGCDFYTGNLHKWTFAPKGCAFLWTAKGSSFQSESCGVQPLVISSSGKHSYVDRFAYTGTRDYTAFACIPSSFDFAEEHFGGFRRIFERNHDLIIRAANYCAAHWGTFVLVPHTLSIGVMMDVVLPPNAQSEEKLLHIQKCLDEEYKTYFVFNKTQIGPQLTWFTRLSSQVYLEFDQFELFAERLLDVLGQCEQN